MAGHRGRNAAIAAGGVITVIFFAWILGFITLPGPGPTPTSAAVPFTGGVALYGGAATPYGTVTVVANGGATKGTYTLVTGVYSTGQIPTGAGYNFYYNGTTVYWPMDYPADYQPGSTSYLAQPNNFYSVPAWSGTVDKNSLINIPTMTVYTVATTYTDALLEVTYNGLSGCSRTQSGSSSMANDTSIIKNVPITFNYVMSVSSTFAARAFAYDNPLYQSNGAPTAVQGFVWIVSNSTNVVLAPGSIGTRITPIGVAGIFAIPINPCISSQTPNSITTPFQLIFPTAQHPTMAVYTVWNTNLATLQNSASSTPLAPLGFTVGSFQFLANKDASHTTPIWTVT